MLVLSPHLSHVLGALPPLCQCSSHPRNSGVQVAARTNLYAAPASYTSLHIGGMLNLSAWAQQRWWGWAGSEQ